MDRSGPCCYRNKKLAGLYFLIFCTCFFSVFCNLNIITITAGPFAGSGIEPMESTFAVALDNLSRQYPELYANYSQTNLEIVDNENACTESGNQKAATFLQKWYGEGVFERSGLTVILTSRT